jgi:hypothetical protein
MSFKQNTQFNRGRKATKRVLIGETREEEAARLEKEIAAHPVTHASLAEVTHPPRDPVGATSRSFLFQNG